MPRANSCNSAEHPDPPQISFTSWILGGPLITGSRRSSRGKHTPASALVKTGPVAAKAEKGEEVKTDSTPVAVDEDGARVKEDGDEEKKVEEETDKGGEKGNTKKKKNVPTTHPTIYRFYHF
jgi:hypothetical protein